MLNTTLNLSLLNLIKQKALIKNLSEELYDRTTQLMITIWKINFKQKKKIVKYASNINKKRRETQTRFCNGSSHPSPRLLSKKHLLGSTKIDINNDG